MKLMPSTTALFAAAAPVEPLEADLGAEKASRIGPWAGLALGVGLLALLVETVAFVVYGTTVYDEGGYLYEGWLTVSRGWMPFRDFYAKIPPLLYYLYGLGQHLAGPSLLVGRVESALFMFGTVWLAALMARRVAGGWAAALVVWLVAVSPGALNAYLHAYAIAPTAFFMVLALYLLTATRQSAGTLYGGAVATGAMLLCRHDLAPFAVALAVYVLVWHPARVSQRVTALAVGALTFAVVMLPFAIAAPENVLSTLTLGKLGPQIVAPAGYGEATPASLHSICWHVMIFVRYCAATLLLLAPGLWWGLKRSREAVVWVALGAAGVQWLSHVPAALFTGGNVFYLLDLYIFPAMVVAAAGLYVQAARSFRGAARTFVRTAAAAIVLLCPILTGPGPHFQFSLARPTQVEQVRRGAEALRRHVQPQETIFTLDDPQQFLEAKLLIPAPLTHELFGYRESKQTAELRRLHFFNDEMIREWLGGGAQVAVISAGAEQFMATSDRYGGGKRLHDLVMGLIRRNYQLVAEEPGTLAGPLRIYRLREQAP
ncbi:MAG: glycosyltransferase family 39 protein [Armatimonadia bacterium]